MGGGASLDGGLGLEPEMQRYLCHACHRVVTSQSLSSREFVCPNCNSTFIEELGGVLRHSDLMPHRQANNRFVNMFGSDELNSEQSRRITNASAMLRMLESQLREELEQLQLAFESSHQRMSDEIRNGVNRNAAAAAASKKKLTKIMAGKIRMKKLDLDTLCSQPSCPICSEDFVVSSSVTKLPCTHIFHHSCVVPWLEMKQNCPICRAEITDEIPSLTELEKLSTQELACWLDLMRDPAVVNFSSCYDCTTDTTGGNTARKSEGKEDEHIMPVPVPAEKEPTVEPDDRGRSEMALRLQEELVLYQKDAQTAQSEAEALQAQQARALSYGLGSMRGISGVGSRGGAGGVLGRAVHVQGPLDRPVGEYFHYDPGAARSMNHSASSPAVRAIDEYIASPNRTTSSERRLTRLQSEPEGSIATALRRGFPGPGASTHENNHGNNHSITGSTLLPNGLHLHHSIRIVDDSEGEDEDAEGEAEGEGEGATGGGDREGDHSTGDSSSVSSTANETQRLLYHAANQAHLAQFGVGGLSNHTSSPARNLDSPSRNVGRMDSSSEAIMREFNRSLHTELGLTNDQMPRAERNLLNSHAEGLHSAQLLNNLINGPFPQHQHQHQHLSPSWREEMDGILTSAGLSGASVARVTTSSTTSEAPMRSAQMAAIDRYMGADVATRFNALNNYNTSTAGSYAPTTYQIRATGDGSFRTVPVTHTQTTSGHRASGADSDLER